MTSRPSSGVGRVFGLVVRLVALSIVWASLTTSGASTNQISRWGITWQFSAHHQFGKFANGDFWVVGPVTITSMLPAWDGTQNGWEINPLYRSAQGFSNVPGIAANSYDPDLRVSLPFTINEGSVVKVIGGDNGGFSVIQNAAVLTVLSTAPSNEGTNYFRPPYSGTDKPLFRVDQLRMDRLPRYAPTSGAPSLATVAANFSKGLRLDYRSANAREFRPFDVMEDYQPKNSMDLNNAMLRLMLNDTESAKMPALIQFTQHSLDMLYVYRQGYRATGTGHNPNHRVLGAWAAIMLDLSEMIDWMSSAEAFHEDQYLYDGRNGALWGQVQSTTEVGYWNYLLDASGSRSHKDPYGYIDGGEPGTDYQIVTSQSLKGQALIYQLFPELQRCAPPAKVATLIAYGTRWRDHGVWALPDPVAPVNGGSANYGVTFGPDGSGGYIAGNGRFPTYHGQSRDGGQYRSSFVASMWDAYVGGSSPAKPVSPRNLRLQSP